MHALHLNIYVTDFCNRKCSYCYNPMSESSLKTMTSKTAIDVGNWIGKVSEKENIQNFRAHFLGGEPFLNLPAIYNIVDTIDKKYNVPPAAEGKYIIFTNGDFLTESNLQEIKKRRILIYLHCVNDLSLLELERRIALVKYICGGCSLSIVIDDSPIERFVEIIKLAIKHKCHPRMNALYEVEENQVKDYTEIYRTKISTALNMLIDSNWAVYPNFLQSEQFVTWDKIGINPHFCGKCFYVIDAVGGIRSCTLKNTDMGNIYENTDLGTLHFHQRHSAKYIKECQDCQYITWCQGGCPMRRKIASGSYNNKIYLCDVYKELFSKVFILRDRWLKFKEAGNGSI